MCAAAVRRAALHAPSALPLLLLLLPPLGTSSSGAHSRPPSSTSNSRGGDGAAAAVGTGGAALAARVEQARLPLHPSQGVWGAGVPSLPTTPLLITG